MQGNTERNFEHDVTCEKTMHKRGIVTDTPLLDCDSSKCYWYERNPHTTQLGLDAPLITYLCALPAVSDIDNYIASSAMQ